VPEGGGNGSAIRETPMLPEYEGYDTPGEATELRRGNEEEARTDQHTRSC